MSKKILCALLLAAMVLSLVACGTSGAGTASEKPAESTTPAETTTPVESVAPVQESTTPEPSGEYQLGDIQYGIDFDAEPYIVDYFMSGQGQSPSEERIENAINAHIKDLINAQVNFTMLDSASWNEKCIVAVQSGEKCDLMFTSGSNYMRDAAAGLFTPLNDPNLETYGDLINDYCPSFRTNAPKDAFLFSNLYNGLIWGVPVYKEICVPNGIIYNTEVLEKVGMLEEATNGTWTDYNIWDFLDKYLPAAKEAFPDYDGFAFSGGLDNLLGAGDSNFGIRRAPVNGQWEEDLHFRYEWDETRHQLEKMAEYYDLGYLNPDSMLDTYDYWACFNGGKWCVDYSEILKGFTIKSDEMIAASGNDNLRCTEVQTEPKIKLGHNNGSMQAVPSTSENPLVALKYLELNYRDEVVVNLHLWGEEGIDYTKRPDVGPMAVEASPNSDWIGTCPAAWKCGNILIQYVSIKEAQDKNQKLIDFAETDDVLTNAFFGFNFNTTTVTAERASVSAAQTGLTRSLLGGGYGKAGWAAKADELTKKSYDAGMQVIMDEYIKQYNEWKASK